MTVTSHDLIHATSGGGRFRVGVIGGRCVRICLLCDAEFEQSDEGFAALKEHEFFHGMGTLFGWSELQGKTLRMVVVPYDDPLYKSEADLYGVDDANGVVYHLNHDYGHEWQAEVGGWKWKITKQTRPDDSPLLMLNGLVSPSNG